MDHLRQTGKIIDEDRIRDRIILEKQTNLISKNDNLIFINNSDFGDDESRHIFYSLVDRTITDELRHLNLKLNKFRLKTTTYDPRFEVHLNSFIRYALDCNVQDLDICLSTLLDDLGKPVDLVVFDKSFFINPSFTRLKLQYCCFANPTGFSISWENLKSLYLSSIADLNNDLIQSILSGSPRLETLKLNYCHRFTRLDITSKSVKKVGISRCIPRDFLHLNAPSILSLTIQGSKALYDLVLLDVFSLVKAKFYFQPFYFTPDLDDHEYDMLKRHILQLGHVKHELKLKLGRRCSEILSVLEAQGFIVPPNIKLVFDYKLV